jgi:starch synthase
MRVLFAASELYPLIKTGGLGDVAHSLPDALVEHGVDMRVVVPAYRDVLVRLQSMRLLGWLPLSGGHEARVFQGRHRDVDSTLWLVDVPGVFDRGGAPYTDANGHGRHDNAERFTLFCEAAAALARDAVGLGWRADVVHANDWQTGLLPAYTAAAVQRPRTVFTVHNLAYDCQFDHTTFQALELPGRLWSVDRGEFYDRFSMLKCGLMCSDHITTVSPRYAEEIRLPEFGYGYASILEAQAGKLTGILNGIDVDTWDPATDTHLAANFGIGGKIRPARRANRQALLEALGAPAAVAQGDAPLVGSVGRLVYQKGIDLLLESIPRLIEESPACFVVIGAGEQPLEQQLRDLVARYPGRVFSHVGYSEQLAHLLEGGCDMFAMPSRYEPCGLNQMYSLRYGAPPVVRNTGGLADTVIDADPDNLARGTANGFVFDEATPAALQAALHRAFELFQRPKQWMRLIKTGMRTDFSWQQSAARYLELYQQ